MEYLTLAPEGSVAGRLWQMGGLSTANLVVEHNRDAITWPELAEWEEIIVTSTGTSTVATNNVRKIEYG